MNVLKDMLMRIKKLEEEIEKLKGRGAHGTRLNEISFWILSNFDSKYDEIEVSKIMKKGVKKGFSRQMMQRARRELLEDKIGISRVKGKGFTWIRLND